MSVIQDTALDTSIKYLLLSQENRRLVAAAERTMRELRDHAENLSPRLHAYPADMMLREARRLEAALCRQAKLSSENGQLLSGNDARTERYRVTANMFGGSARGGRVYCVVGVGDDPYTTGDLATAERVADECRALPQSYREVRIEQVSA